MHELCIFYSLLSRPTNAQSIYILYIVNGFNDSCNFSQAEG